VFLTGPKGLLALRIHFARCSLNCPPLLLSDENAVRFGEVLGIGLLLIAAVVAFGQNVLEKMAIWQELAGPGALSLDEYKQEVAAALRGYGSPC